MISISTSPMSMHSPIPSGLGKYTFAPLILRYSLRATKTLYLPTYNNNETNNINNRNSVGTMAARPEETQLNHS